MFVSRPFAFRCKGPRGTAPRILQCHACPRRELLAAACVFTIWPKQALAIDQDGVPQDMVELLEAQANQFFADRDFASALEVLDRLVRLQPGTARWREFRGAIRTDNKDFRGALEDYNGALAILDRQGLGQLSDPDRARMLAGRALVYEGLSDWRGALADYEEAQRIAAANGFLPDPYILNSTGNVLASLVRVCPLLPVCPRPAARESAGSNCLFQGDYKGARAAYLDSARAFQSARGFRGRNGSTTQR